MELCEYHKELDENGEGKCSVPMWRNSMPAGFCDRIAYGYPEFTQRRYGIFDQEGKWCAGYSSGLVCYAHGGPEKKQG